MMKISPASFISPQNSLQSVECMISGYLLKHDVTLKFFHCRTPVVHPQCPVWRWRYDNIVTSSYKVPLYRVLNAIIYCVHLLIHPCAFDREHESSSKECCYTLDSGTIPPRPWCNTGDTIRTQQVARCISTPVQTASQYNQIILQRSSQVQ
ncbi:hypothetical protein BO85DRAFT_154408 [Aspergillus piperis CBS 112811]|uniref:Uncharacterized protein n=1 Tax=Aspergillus piperis CBS 112811 TaxID=1448313 RepID=A0A8G1QSM9_9EURO|nr:hypothetical protein BO85DRAFT_154408 [Aspergillus piperis CBS 112811]RAH53561.1 hypothetical protein BO85DRAFT_154408 [Aspergillus piperis CBS 112811]